MSVKKISQNIWKIIGDSNVYFLDFEEKILIDTGNRKDNALIKSFLTKLIPLEKINKVIFTHLHYDHVGNFDLFPNAEFFASVEAIEDLKKNPLATILKQDIAEKFKTIDLKPAEDCCGLKIINTPGHTRGGICIWYEKEKILFSGDTMFYKGLGRTDLPTSVPDEMHKTVMKLLELNHKILCPGHDY